MRPRLLDLFCGAGGAGMGYALAGFEVTGVDHRFQARYPFTFVQADALGFLEQGGADGFDAIHASPPCQAYSRATSRNRVFVERERSQLAIVPRHLDLVGATRTALEATGLPYVIENVGGAPLRSPVVLCGSSFGLDVRRHRLFESSFRLWSPPCQHHLQADRFPPNDTRRPGRLASVVTVGGHITYPGELEQWQEAMQIDWMRPAELAQAIPPAYTRHIAKYLAAHLVAERRTA